MDKPTQANGWLIVPCSAPDMARVEVGVGDEDVAWLPAFRDWHADTRVAKVRTHLDRPVHIWLRVNGTVTAKHFVRP